MRQIKEGEKRQSCLYLDSEIKLCGFMLAKSRGISFSEYVELLILEDYTKNIELLEKRGYING